MPLNLFQVQEGKRTGQQSQNTNNLEGCAEEWAPSRGQWGVSEESKQESGSLTWLVPSVFSEEVEWHPGCRKYAHGSHHPLWQASLFYLHL